MSYLPRQSGKAFFNERYGAYHTVMMDIMKQAVMIVPDDSDVKSYHSMMKLIVTRGFRDLFDLRDHIINKEPLEAYQIVTQWTRAMSDAIAPHPTWPPGTNINDEDQKKVMIMLESQSRQIIGEGEEYSKKQITNLNPDRGAFVYLHNVLRIVNNVFLEDGGRNSHNQVKDNLGKQVRTYMVWLMNIFLCFVNYLYPENTQGFRYPAYWDPFSVPPQTRGGGGRGTSSGKTKKNPTRIQKKT